MPPPLVLLAAHRCSVLSLSSPTAAAVGAYWRYFALCQLGLYFGYRTHPEQRLVCATGEPEDEGVMKGGWVGALQLALLLSWLGALQGACAGDVETANRQPAAAAALLFPPVRRRPQPRLHAPPEVV